MHINNKAETLYTINKATMALDSKEGSVSSTCLFRNHQKCRCFLVALKDPMVWKLWKRFPVLRFSNKLFSFDLDDYKIKCWRCTTFFKLARNLPSLWRMQICRIMRLIARNLCCADRHKLAADPRPWGNIFQPIPSK